MTTTGVAPPLPLRIRALRSLLGGGLLYLTVFVLVHAVLALTTDGATPADLVCLVLVSAPQLVLIRRVGAHLPRRWSAGICLTLATAAAVGLWTMHPGHADQSYAAWFLGAITFDLFGLALLGSTRAAWLTMAAVVVLCVLWGVTHDAGALGGLGLVVRHVATLLVGTALTESLRRSREAFAVFRALRLRRSTEEEASRAERAARRAEVEQVLDLAGPTLGAIADGRRSTPEDRRQMLVLEGSLRDRIRTPRLVRGGLRDSVDAARRRGVNVLLMDEAEGAAGPARTAASTWLAERLDGVGAGGFVGRVRDLGDVVRVTAVHDDAGESQSFHPSGTAVG